MIINVIYLTAKFSRYTGGMIWIQLTFDENMTLFSHNNHRQ